MQAAEAYTGIDNLEVMQEARNYNRYLLNLVRSHARQGRVIDFGAGAGTFAVPMTNLGFDVTAIEPDATLRHHLAGQSVAVAADASEVPDGSIGYAYTLNVLEHIQDDLGALRQLFAKLAPDSTLLVYVPALPMLYTSMDEKVGHIRRYERAGLIRTVNAAGFTVQRVEYVDCIGVLATLLFKWLGNSSGDVNRTALKIYDRCIFPISRAADLLMRRWLGKNLLLVARKHAAVP